MAVELYACTTCKAHILPLREGTIVVVRGRRVLLLCGHTASLGAARLHRGPPRDLTPEETEELLDRLTGDQA